MHGEYEGDSSSMDPPARCERAGLQCREQRCQKIDRAKKEEGRKPRYQVLPLGNLDQLTSDGASERAPCRARERAMSRRGMSETIFYFIYRWF